MGRNTQMRFFSKVKFSLLIITFLIFPVFGNLLSKIKREVKNLPGFYGMVAYDLSRDRIIFKVNSKKLFKPASILKVITAYSFLKQSGVEKKFTTKIYLDSLPDKNGILMGNIYIYGGGDPSLSYRFFDNDRNKPVDYVLGKILEKFNLKEIRGDIIVDDSKFLYKPYGPSWSWEVFQWAYGTKVSATTLNDNTINVRLTPLKNGKKISVNTLPHYFEKLIVNECVSRKKSTIKDLIVFKPFDSDLIFISGYLPTYIPNWNLKIAVTDPAKYFGEFLAERMKKRGIKFYGKVRVIHRYPYRRFKVIDYSKKICLSVKGKKVKMVLKKMLKKSINLYAELLLRYMGSLNGKRWHRDERKCGISFEYKILYPIIIKGKNSFIFDGSGLSQRNLITPHSLIDILKDIYKSKYFRDFLEFLPISGKDGTLKNRMKGKYRGRIFAKTGQIEEVVSRMGYIRSFSNRWIAFVIITNNDPFYKVSTKDKFDRICKLLCKY